MSAINCNREKINSENYMGYNGSHGCYKMFTKGQVQRMYKALHHSSREKLWQKENLIDTGLMERDLLANNQFDKQATLNIYPNPFNSNIEISIDEKIKEAKLFTILGEEILVNLHPLNENLIHIERLESLKTGLYIIKITTLSGKTFSKKMTKK
ncbi:hypothetical protein AQ623_14005 [Flavobacterium columnare]|nr:hypothetical protein AQ623_14005 [Flavobacterium columnare]